MASGEFFGQLEKEALWEHARRPYHNVRPSIVPMLTRLNLDIDSALIELPLPALCIRLLKQQNPLTFEWQGRSFDIRCMLTGAANEGKTILILIDIGEIVADVPVYTYQNLFRKYSSDQTLAKLEADARQNRRGLWVDPNPTPPWDWRDQHRSPTRALLAEVPVVPNGVSIAALLPNPDGKDEGHEQLMIRNSTDRVVDLRGWRLLDRGGNKFQLSGKVAAGRAVTVTLNPPTMALNNDGDEVWVRAVYQPGGGE